METGMVEVAVLLQIFIVGAGIEIIRRIIKNSNYIDKNTHEKLCKERLAVLKEKIGKETDIVNQLMKAINKRFETLEKRLDNIERILLNKRS